MPVLDCLKMIQPMKRKLAGLSQSCLCSLESVGEFYRSVLKVAGGWVFCFKVREATDRQLLLKGEIKKKRKKIIWAFKPADCFWQAKGFFMSGYSWPARWGDMLSWKRIWAAPADRQKPPPSLTRVLCWLVRAFNQNLGTLNGHIQTFLELSFQRKDPKSDLSIPA